MYLLGESFGGILALAVAAARPDLVDRIVLVNPATSFPRTQWQRLGPLLTSVPQASRSPLYLDSTFSLETLPLCSRKPAGRVAEVHLFLDGLHQSRVQA